MKRESNNIRDFMLRGVLCAGLALAVFAAAAPEVPAQSAQTKANANARWGGVWTQFSSAVNKKDRKKVIALTSKDFQDEAGNLRRDEGDQLLVDWLASSWASLRRSIRRGIKGYKGDPGEIMRITKDNSLIFEYKQGRWLFRGPLKD